MCVVLVLNVIKCSCHYFLDRILFHHDVHHDSCENHWDFMTINYLLIFTLGFLCLSSFGTANAQLPGCFRPWTFSLNIGLNMFSLDSFMSCLHSLLGYSTVEFQALQLIVLAAFGACNILWNIMKSTWFYGVIAMQRVVSANELAPSFRITSLNGDISWLLAFCARNSPVTPHKSQWRENVIFSFICTSTNCGANNGDARYLMRHGAHCSVTVMYKFVFHYLARIFVNFWLDRQSPEPLSKFYRLSKI